MHERRPTFTVSACVMIGEARERRMAAKKKKEHGACMWAREIVMLEYFSCAAAESESVLHPGILGIQELVCMHAVVRSERESECELGKSEGEKDENFWGTISFFVGCDKFEKTPLQLCHFWAPRTNR